MYNPWPNKYLILLLFTVLITTSAIKAQPGKEAWHWQFGQNAALDFSSGTPVSGTCAINTTEGSASVSDPNTGQLLFYTDGTTVWNKNNTQMPNGFGLIGGNGTSTQAALIVPKPGSSTIYYLFSADQGGYCCPGNPMANQGVNYSIVDMSLNNGLGDVIASTKNTLLTPPPTTEKLTAVRHCNGRDYWIITHAFNSNAFNVYLLTAAGINPTPVVSSVGTMQNNVFGNSLETIGYMKVSPNGRKLACAVGYMHFIEIYDFDNSTGIISNPIKKSYFLSNYGAYGIAFSPDNTKLYTTLESIGLWQFDLSSNDSATIVNSQNSIYATNGNGFMEAAQLGIDGKIYISFQDSTKLSVINNPNSLGLSCNFQFNSLILSTGSKSLSGLPNFIDANNIIPKSRSYETKLCVFPVYTVTAAIGSEYVWSTGDTNRATSIHNFGNYAVSYLDSIGCREIDTFYITQIQPPAITVLKDTAQCSNLAGPVTINATYANTTSYSWNDGFTSPVRTITDTGRYWIDYTQNNFCVSRDSFSYILHTIPLINLGPDTTFCKGDLFLNAFNPSSAYLWSTGQTSPSITAMFANTYWVKVTNNYGCVNTDTLIVYPQLTAFNFTLPNIVTPNNDGINDFIDFGIYQFSSLQLEVYNRWGNKVFESSDPSYVWKPTEEDGTYFMLLNYRIDCGSAIQAKILKGFVTIVR